MIASKNDSWPLLKSIFSSQKKANFVYVIEVRFWKYYLFSSTMKFKIGSKQVLRRNYSEIYLKTSHSFKNGRLLWFKNYKEAYNDILLYLITLQIINKLTKLKLDKGYGHIFFHHFLYDFDRWNFLLVISIFLWYQVYTNSHITFHTYLNSNIALHI